MERDRRAITRARDRGSRRRGAHLLGLLLGLFLIVSLSSLAITPARAHPTTSSRSVGACGRPTASKARNPVVGPTAFGRVVEANRSSLVRVRLAAGQSAWSTGFLVGAKGEIVFGTSKAPPRALTVELMDGRSIPAELLGFDLGLSLAVARLRVSSGARPPLPLRPSTKPGLTARTWVVSMTHDPGGEAVAYAGVVVGEAVIERDRRALFEVRAAPVDVPGRAGAPVLSVEGDLVGVVRSPGERKTRVMPIEVVIPFLRRVVLGHAAR